MAATESISRRALARGSEPVGCHVCHWLCQCLHDRRLVRSLRPNVALAKLSHSSPTCKPLAGRALAKPVAHKKPHANAWRLMHEACHAINQPTCVSTRFLNLLDVTCATGFASVFTIGGLYVACALTLPWQSCLTRVLLQAVGRKSTGKASGTQETAR